MIYDRDLWHAMPCPENTFDRTLLRALISQALQADGRLSTGLCDDPDDEGTQAFTWCLPIAEPFDVTTILDGPGDDTAYARVVVTYESRVEVHCCNHDGRWDKLEDWARATLALGRMDAEDETEMAWRQV